MKIVLAFPGISHASALASKSLPDSEEFLEIPSFKATDSTLEVFRNELANIAFDDLWCIGIPHWPLLDGGFSGVAGPGLPSDELFVPDSIKSDMEELCGNYDKWRPYPAEEPLSGYAIKMARKFSTKRGKAFEHIFKYCPFETILWVEHAAASMAHLDQKAASDVMDRVLSKALPIVRSRPAVDFVCFSPYGADGSDGFVVSNRLEASKLTDWGMMRSYIGRSKRPPSGAAQAIA